DDPGRTLDVVAGGHGGLRGGGGGAGGHQAEQRGHQRLLMVPGHFASLEVAGSCSISATLPMAFEAALSRRFIIRSSAGRSAGKKKAGASAPARSPDAVLVQRRAVFT